MEMWKVLLRILAAFSLICGNATTPAIKPQSQRGIIFPTDERHDECFIDEERQIKGSCKKLSECPTAVNRWEHEDVRPQTCYFNKFDHIICCELEEPPVTDRGTNLPLTEEKRPSQVACDEPFFRVAVVHGEPTVPNEFPYMTALGWESNFDKSIIYRCGGVLISFNFVLTAAHCTEMGGIQPVVVRVGGTNLTQTDQNVHDVKIKRIIVHPGYNVTSSYNDIALLELEESVGEKAACVWSQPELVHNNVTAIGYGDTRFAGVSSDQLLKAHLFLVTNEECEKFYTPEAEVLERGIANTHICAGDPEHLRDTCQGDSGGPIIMKVRNDMFSVRDYVVGITSFGKGCGGEPPSIYTRISSYIDWIEDNVWPAPNVDLRQNKKKFNI